MNFLSRMLRKGSREELIWRRTSLLLKNSVRKKPRKLSLKNLRNSFMVDSTPIGSTLLSKLKSLRVLNSLRIKLSKL